jgi:hypothetical protein
MDEATKQTHTDVTPKQRPAYDPNNLHPADAEARQYDDTSEGIDWDEIIATTQDDWIARRFAFNTADYPTPEEGMEAMKKHMDSILQEVLDEIAAERLLDATRR